MKNALLALALVALPGAASAAPCIPGSLSSYLGLGAAGCTVGTALFSEFATFSPTGSATPIAAGDIFVTPVDAPYNPGLRFEVNRTAGPGDVLQALFGYQASGSPFTANGLSIAGTAVTPDGAVTAVENKCLGGTFTGGQTGCTGSDALLIAFDIGVDADLEEVLAFGPTGLLAIVNDLVIDGGIGGSATLGSATNQFTAVPEPATASLLLLGSAAATLVRRRRARMSSRA